MTIVLDWVPDISGNGARTIVRDPLSHLLIAFAWVSRQFASGRWGYAVERACDSEVRFGYRASEALAREAAEIVATAWLSGPIIASGKPFAR